MKIHALLAVMTALTLAACNERENPLAKVEEDTLVTWLKDRDDPIVSRMVVCAPFWSEETGTEIPADSRADCNDLAEFLSAEMTAAGFGEVTTADVYLPTVWTAFRKTPRQVFDPKKAADTIR